MLRKTKLFFSGLSVILMVFLTGFVPDTRNADESINGAWMTRQSTLEQVLLFSDGYFMHTIFDRVNKQFIQSRGGTYSFSGKDLVAKIEFNTHDKEQIGQSISYSFSVNKNKLNSDISGKKSIWDILDKGEGGNGRYLAYVGA